MLKPLFALLLATSGLYATNQTDDLSPILPPQSLPFEVSVMQSDFQLPSDSLNSTGLQSFCFAVHDGKWLLLAGRTNGLHGFNPNNNFPAGYQNTMVYVVDPKKKSVVSKSLYDASSHLTQEQIDTLSVTDAQFYQAKETLYIVGGYGVDTLTGGFGTKSTLTVIDVPGLMHWVESSSSKITAAKQIRQTSHPLLQVAGGMLTQTDPHHPFLLVFGQNYSGEMSIALDGSYTRQIRAFKILDNGHKLYIQPEKQHTLHPSYRRTDLNVVPIMQKSANTYKPSYVALSGVFTEDFGVWTVPVLIDANGKSSMPDPSSASTFKQGMNNYNCATVGLFSKKTNEMFTMLFGGLSYLVAQNGTFSPDPEIPFINSITTVKRDSHGNFEQYLMESEYPVIYSMFSNPGNVLLFGTEARFIPTNNLPAFTSGVFSLDELGSSPIVLGYIVGGIQSTVPNTSTPADTAGSPYIFSVILEKR
jgi:hypothetical protein